MVPDHLADESTALVEHAENINNQSLQKKKKNDDSLRPSSCTHVRQVVYYFTTTTSYGFSKIVNCEWSLRGHRKTSQKPSEMNKTSFTSNLLPPPHTNKSLHFSINSPTDVNKKKLLEASRVIFVNPLTPPPPQKKNVVRVTGLL